MEIKIKVPQLSELRQRLQAAGATEEGDVLELNRFFDTPQHTLRSRDSGLRIRTNSNIWQKTARHVMTFKGPRQQGAVKTRREIEFEIADASLGSELLEALGFECELSFEKRRQYWSLDRCEVALDELPLLGNFIEIEGPAADAIESVRATLGLVQSPTVSQSYIEMLVTHCAEHGITQRVIRFPS